MFTTKAVRTAGSTATGMIKRTTAVVITVVKIMNSTRKRTGAVTGKESVDEGEGIHC